MYSLCIVTATTGKDTLTRALESARPGPFDEWLVVGNGFLPDAHLMVHRLQKDGRADLLYFHSAPTGNHGNEQRDHAMLHSDKDYFVFLNETDIFRPGALDTIQRYLKGTPVLFKLETRGGVIWEVPNVQPGNIRGSMLVVPNMRDRMSRWGYFFGDDSDFQFVQDTLALWKNSEIRWVDETIIRIEPDD